MLDFQYLARRGAAVSKAGRPRLAERLRGWAAYIEARSGAQAAQYKSVDGKYYQMPWKTNPVMIFYNKDVFQKAGLDATNPALSTYAEFLSTSATLVSKGGVTAAIWPSPTSEFFQPWFDFYPLFIAESNGKRLVENGVPQFASPDGLAVGNFLQLEYIPIDFSSDSDGSLLNITGHADANKSADGVRRVLWSDAGGKAASTLSVPEGLSKK